jgi:hypothetical protein
MDCCVTRDLARCPRHVRALVVASRNVYSCGLSGGADRAGQSRQGEASAARPAPRPAHGGRVVIPALVPPEPARDAYGHGCHGRSRRLSRA